MPTTASLRRRTLLVAFAGVASGARAVGGPPNGEAIDLAAAIDMAGRQRMLTQRIVKAYCQLGLAVASETSRVQLAEAVDRFDTQLAQLKAAAPTAAARRALARCAALWKPFRRLATAAPGVDGARALAEHAERLLQAAEDVVVALQDAAGTAQARFVNVSGRQRMLSQRMAMLYMLRAWGVDSPQLRGKLDSASQDFSAALASLRAAPENSNEIAKELDAVALQWEWFSGAIKLQGSQSFTLVVADASELILSRMEQVTALYADPARR